MKTLMIAAGDVCTRLDFSYLRMICLVISNNKNYKKIDCRILLFIFELLMAFWYYQKKNNSINPLQQSHACFTLPYKKTFMQVWTR